VCIGDVFGGVGALLEHFMDMDMMEIGIVGVDEDVVQVSKDTNIKEVAKNVLHESLEGGWKISKSERQNTSFKGTIAGLECDFPFITFTDSDKMVGMLEVNVGEQSCFTWTVQEIGDLGEWVAVFLGDFIEATEINAKME